MWPGSCWFSVVSWHGPSRKSRCSINTELQRTQKRLATVSLLIALEEEGSTVGVPPPTVHKAQPSKAGLIQPQKILISQESFNRGSAFYLLPTSRDLELASCSQFSWCSAPLSHHMDHPLPSLVICCSTISCSRDFSCASGFLFTKRRLPSRRCLLATCGV